MKPMTDEPDLENAYALNGPDGTKSLYADWAQTYDDSFAQSMAYRLPVEVAHAYLDLGISGPVLDLGAGTGLVGACLSSLGVGPIDGVDLSPEMMAQAAAKGIYDKLFEGDLTKKLDVPDGHYQGAVSAGTFTNGHVGPDALEDVLRILKRGGWAVVSVNSHHWTAMGFEAVLTRLSAKIAEVRRVEIAIYGDDATGEHAHDRAWLLQLKRA
jgi:predicted TPR repeat methyltransferase